MPRVEVRLLKNLDEYRQCERYPDALWGAPGATREVLTAAQKYGGALIGTLIDGKVVGFIFAFLAQYHGRSGPLVTHDGGGSEVPGPGIWLQDETGSPPNRPGARHQVHLLDVRPACKAGTPG